MFCIYCGKPTEGENDTCPACAAIHAQPPVQPEPYAQPAPVYEQPAPTYQQHYPVYQQPAPTYQQPAPTYQQPAPTYQQPAAVVDDELEADTFQLNIPEAPKKKVSGKVIGLICGAAVLVAAVLLVVLNWSSIMSLLGIAATPQDYMIQVEEKAMASQIAAVTDSYGQYLVSLNNPNNAVDAEIHLLLGDNIQKLLETALEESGIPLSTEWLSDVMLQLNVKTNDNLWNVNGGIGLGSSGILSVDAILDLAGDSLLLGFPELHPDYLKISDISQMMGAGGMSFSDMMLPMQQANQKLLDTLPTPEVLETLLTKYTGMIFRNIQNVEKGTASMTVGDITQDFTTITAVVYEKDLLNIFKAMLIELQQDPQAQSLLVAFMEYSMSSSPSYSYAYDDATGEYVLVPMYPGVDAEAMLKDSIDVGLAQLEEMIAQSSEENYLTVITYVDDDQQICGRTIIGNDGGYQEEIMRYLFVRSGDAFQADTDLGGSLIITGNGKDADGKTSGTFQITADGMQMVQVELENISENGGLIRIIPSQSLVEDFLYEMDLDGAGLFSSVDVALELDILKADKTSKAEIRVMVSDKLLLGFTVSATESDDAAVSLPAGGVDVMDDAASMQWISQLDFSKLLENMRNAGVPTELVSGLEYVFSMMLQSMNY